MAISKKEVIGIGVVGVAIIGGRYLLSLKRASHQIVTTVNGKKGRITAQGISIQLTYNIKNPTRVKMELSAPLIKLFFNGKLLASSTMQYVEIPPLSRTEDGKIKIEAFQETGEISTMITIPWVSVLGISSGLMQRLKSIENKVQLNVETVTQIFTKAGNFPFNDTTRLEI